jgi:hypothetical protein
MARRLILASILTAMIVGWSVGTSAADDENRGFWVEETNIQTGKVTAGDEVTGTFVFHNASDADVKIIRAKPS